MRIVHALAPARFGGLEHVVRSLACGQVAHGHDVQVFAVVDGPHQDHPLTLALNEGGVEVVPLRSDLSSYRAEARTIRELCRRLAPVVLHTHGYRSDVIDGWTASRSGVPVVSTVHGFTRGGGKNRIYEYAQKRALRRFDAVVAVSGPIRDELARAGVPAERLHVIPNAWSAGADLLPRLDARAALGVGPDTTLLGWVGRLSDEKGADVLLDALPGIADMEPVVVFVGDGPQRDALEQRARSSGVEPLARWAGEIEEASRLFSAFDLFVLSSRTEGTPIVLFEAMAAGVPIVATRVGGVPDVVPAGEALLVPPEDPDALASAIRNALEDRDAARTRAAAARARLSEEYSSDSWLIRYEACYRTAMYAREVEP